MMSRGPALLLPRLSEGEAPGRIRVLRPLPSCLRDVFGGVGVRTGQVGVRPNASPPHFGLRRSPGSF